MKVLLTNVCDLYNKGEVALVTSVAANLPDAEITIAPVFSFINPVFCEKLKIKVAGRMNPLPAPLLFIWCTLTLFRAEVWSIVNRLLKVNLAFLLNTELRAYYRSDLIVDLGGDTFSDDYGFAASCMHCYSLLLTLMFSKPYFVCSQTIGPFKYSITRFLARFFLQRAKVVTVREPKTLRYLTNELKILPSQRLQLIPDLAFMLKKASPEEADALLSQIGIPLSGQPIIAVNPSNLIWRYMFPQLSLEKKYSQYTDLMAQMIDNLPLQANVLLIPNVIGRTVNSGSYKNVDDRAVIQSIFRKIKNKSRVFVVEENLNPHQIKAILAKADLFIGCRMHAVVSAISAGTPTIALSYSHKTTGMIGELLGLNEIIVNVRGEKNYSRISNELFSKIEFTWSERTKIAEALLKKSKNWNKQASVNISLIKKVYVGTKLQALHSNGECNGCGNCAFVCPNKAIIQHRSIDGITVSVDFKICSGCGSCLQACPQMSANRMVDLKTGLIGEYENCWVGQASDDLRENATSGGIVSSLLVNALENGDIDGAIVTKSQGLKTTVSIARSRNEVLAASGSKYCPVDCGEALEAVFNSPGKFAFVGLPCQIAALRKLEESNSAIKDKIALCVGLFCSHNVSFAGTNLLLESMHIEYQDVEALRYRARKGNVTGMLIKTKDGKEKFIPSKKYWTRFFNFFFVPSYCLKCHDLTSELADISIGDAWLPEYKKSGMRYCIFITRNLSSSTMIQSAIAKGLITAKKVDAAVVVESQRLYLQIKKRQTYNAGLFAICNLTLTKIGHLVSIRLKMYSALKVFLRLSRVLS